MPDGGGIVHIAGRDDRQLGLRGERGERVIVGRIQRTAVIGQLDIDPIAAEPLHQICQLPRRLPMAAGAQCLTDRSLAASGENHPIASGLVAQTIEIVDRPALLLPSQLGGRESTGQPVIARLATSQHQQMRSDRIGDALLRRRQVQRKLRSENRLHAGRLGCLREPDDAIEPVVIGQRQPVQTEPLRLLDQFDRTGCAVQK